METDLPDTRYFLGPISFFINESNLHCRIYLFFHFTVHDTNVRLSVEHTHPCLAPPIDLNTKHTYR